MTGEVDSWLKWNWEINTTQETQEFTLFGFYPMLTGEDERKYFISCVELQVL